MIPNVVKGADMPGLVRYLAGPGRANEHTHPHVIGGDGFTQAWNGAQELDRASAAELAAYLEEPRKQYGTEIRTKQWRQNPETGDREPVLDEAGDQAYRDVNVWHCSLSLPAGEALSDDRWEQVTAEFMDEMGFTEASGKAPARWVAIHHGESTNGNDHVHIAASMVREDGTRWDGRFQDFRRAQQICRELEAKHQLTPVDGRQFETATRAPRPVEREIAARAGRPETAREELAMKLRSNAVASLSEAEWLRRVQADGVIIRPRFVAGTSDVVAGYKAAMRTGGDDSLAFYGGGQISRDLSLPRVRENWPAPTVEAADQASAEWQAAFKGRRTGVAGREVWKLEAGDPALAADSLGKFTQRLARTPVTDWLRWSDAARDASGALAAWSRFDPAHATEMREAAAQLARTAQQRRAGGQIGRRTSVSPMGTAYVLLAATKDDRGQMAGEVFLAQILTTATAIRDYHRATRNLAEARAVQVNVIQRLQAIDLTGYAAVPKLHPEQQRAADLQATMNPALYRPASPLPNPLTPRPQQAAGRNREDDRHAGR
ncbi:MAG: relaxase/mobilization nuclease domain-containing protein [Nakamurella sp.]